MNCIATADIKEIAEQLDFGFRVYIHQITTQLLFVPDENSLSDIDLDPWNQELEQLKNNISDYYKIDKWTSSEAFEIMSEFASQLTDNNLQSRIFVALRKNIPFKEFKFVIDNSRDFRQQWFDFKNKWQQKYVVRQLNRLKLKVEG